MNANQVLDLSVDSRSTQSSIIQEIQKVVAKDGTVRRISVNGVEVPREWVEEAMFLNQQVMPVTDQFPLRRTPITLVTSLERQTSMFGRKY